MPRVWPAAPGQGLRLSVFAAPESWVPQCLLGDSSFGPCADHGVCLWRHRSLGSPVRSMAAQNPGGLPGRVFSHGRRNFELSGPSRGDCHPPGGCRNFLSTCRFCLFSFSISLKFTRRPPARVDCRCSGQDLLVPLNLEGRFSGTSKLLQGTFASAVSFHRECPSEHLYSTRRVQHMDWVNGLLRVFCGPRGM